MYQLGMLAFTDSIEQYCKELSNCTATYAPNTPTISSTPLSTKELEVIKRQEIY